ncbi:succinylglutamate desuccinylase/aspartoacylase domain-containing protein [Minwuia thermotolerans]|nr:succinylglutamate desuccinylase/aspartoacylase family protein [Minwuia thermotolerans]
MTPMLQNRESAGPDEAMEKQAARADLMPIDLSGLRRGNTGIDYAHRFDSGRPGPEVLVAAVVHGNELCGVHALVRALATEPRPERGALTFCFCNVAAYLGFDPAAPARARFVDEDFNRLWDAETLDSPRRSSELDRARRIRPLIEQADQLLDLHSMQTGGEPLMLAGTAERGRELAIRVGFPRIVVADPGHAAGRRMRDFGGFGAAHGTRTALLAECGQHRDPAAADNATEVLARFLAATGTLRPEAARRICDWPERPAPRVIEVTDRVTIRGQSFRFVGNPENLDMIEKAGTVIGHDGGRPVETPYDNCVLIMPSRRLATGQTAVRLGRYVA